MSDDIVTPSDERHAAGPIVLPVGVVVVTHGQLAAELVNAAEAIVDDVDVAREEIGAAVGRVATGIGTLVLTDMFGGTPSNLAVTFLAPDRVEVVTGVNLPMLLKIANLRAERDLREIARTVREHGRGAVWVVSDLLEGRQA